LKRKIVTWFFLVGLVVAWFTGRALSEPPNYLDKAALLYNEPTTFILVNDNNPIVYQVLAKDDKESFLGYLTIGCTKGYQSDVYTAAQISPDGTIEGAVVVDENDGPQWVKKIAEEKLVDQFSGKNAADPLYQGHDIDAVSGATITSAGITGGVRQASHYVASVYLKLEPARVNEPWFSFDLLFIPAIWLLALAGLILKKNKLRWVTLSLSVIVIGFMYNACVSIGYFGSIMLGNFPLISINFNWYTMVLGILLTTLILGKNIYCTWICPFGAFQELLHLATGKKLSPGKKVRFLLTNTRKVLIWLVLILMLLSQKPSSYEPFGTLFGFTGDTLQWIILFYTLGVGIISYRFWCHNLCPVGYCVNVLAKVSRTIKGKFRKSAIQERPLETASIVESTAASQTSINKRVCDDMGQPTDKAVETKRIHDVLTLVMFVPGIIVIVLIMLTNYAIINI